MAEQQFKISIQTAAPTGPVDALERSFRNLSRETDRLNSLGTPEAAKVSEWAFYDLDAQLSRTTNTAGQLPGAMDRVSQGGRDNATAILMASQAFEDMQYGIRGVLNNIPGLVMALGGGMGLAGGISIAAVALSELIPLLGQFGGKSVQTKEQADLLAAAIDHIAESARNASDEEIDFAIDAIRAATDEAERLANRWRESDKAAADYELSRLDNQEKIRQALVEFRRLQGEQIDEIAEIQAKEAAASSKRLKVAQQEIDAQALRASEAERNVIQAGENLKKAAELNNTARKELDAQREKLALLRQQRDELEKTVKLGTTTWAQALAEGGFPGQTTPEADRAQARLDAGDFKAELAQAEARIASLEAATSKDGRLTNSLLNAAEKLALASEEAAAISKAVEDASAKIEESFVGNEIVAKVQAAGNVAAQAAVEIKEGVSAIEATTSQQAAAKEELLRLAADGKITTDETVRAMAAVQTLLSGNSAQVSDLLATVQMLQQTQRAQNAEIQRLKQAGQMMNTPGNVR